jgi:DNA topoisomerase-3
LSSDIVPTLAVRLKACAVGPYAAVAGRILQGGIKTGSHMVDDRKVSDHHAIIPTEQPLLLLQLSDPERKIYDLVVKRFLAALLPAYEYEQMTLNVQIAGETFVARGRRVLSPGWREVLDLTDEEDENAESNVREQTFPEMARGQRFKVQSLQMTTGETKPPARFNEATLLSAMEQPAIFMESDNKQLVQTLHQTGGLGTVSTRADIIEKLFASFLIEKVGKDIRITNKGIQLLDLVPAELRTPLLTAEWENKLEQIAKGTLNKQSFLDEMRQYATRAVRQIAQSKQTFRHDNVSSTPCPDCGKPMLDVKDKKGRLLVCQDRACGSRKRVTQTTNARCPQCSKKLELHGTGDSQTFHCGCGYREKLATFLERKEKAAGVSKHEVSKFLEQQKELEREQGPVNPALAEALAKWKEKN